MPPRAPTRCVPRATRTGSEPPHPASDNAGNRARDADARTGSGRPGGERSPGTRGRTRPAGARAVDDRHPTRRRDRAAGATQGGRAVHRADRARARLSQTRPGDAVRVGARVRHRCDSRRRRGLTTAVPVLPTRDGPAPPQRSDRRRGRRVQHRSRRRDEHGRRHPRLAAAAYRRRPDPTPDRSGRTRAACLDQEPRRCGRSASRTASTNSATSSAPVRSARSSGTIG